MCNERELSIVMLKHDVGNTLIPRKVTEVKFNKRKDKKEKWMKQKYCYETIYETISSMMLNCLNY